MRHCVTGVVAAVMVMWVGSSAVCGQVSAVDLLSGLQSGLIWAEFRGAGDAGVTGTVGRYGSGPEQVVIPAGTQFIAQLPGVQGMSATRSIGMDLGQQSVASV